MNPRMLPRWSKLAAIFALLGCHPAGGANTSTTDGTTIVGTTIEMTPGPSTGGTVGGSDPVTGGTTIGPTTGGLTTQTTEETTGGAMTGCPSVEWSQTNYSKRIGFRVDKQPEKLADFPVLVVLPADIDGTAIQKSQSNRLVFTDAMGKILPHDFEESPPITNPPDAAVPDCESRPRNVWVRSTLTDIADTCLYLYLGPEDFSPPNAVSAKDVWSEGFRDVWHVNSSEDAWKNVLGDTIVSCESTGQPMQIECYPSMNEHPWPKICRNGSACRHIGLSESSGLHLDDGLPIPGTVSFWWNHWNAAPAIAFGALTTSSSNCGDPCNMPGGLMDPDGEGVGQSGLKDGNFYFGTDSKFRFFAGLKSGGLDSSETPAAWGVHEMHDWHNVAIARDVDGIRFCVDGVCLPETMVSGTLEEVNWLCFGGEWNKSVGVKMEAEPSEEKISDNYAYLIDEIQLSTVVRSEAWIKAAYLNRICPGQYGASEDEDCDPFITFSEPEERPSDP